MSNYLERIGQDKIEDREEIEQLTARVHELEEENARLKAAAEYAETIRVENIAYFEKQLAAVQLNNKRLRDALEVLAKLGNGDRYGNSEGNVIAQQALAQPLDTSTLDAYVAEKVKEYQERLADALAVLGADSQIEAEAVMLNYKKQISTLTKQRNLAVEALEKIAGRRIFSDSLAGSAGIAEMTLDIIKESEGKR